MTIYAVTINGSVSTELKDKPSRSAKSDIKRRVSILDGTDRFSMMVWKVPPGKVFGDTVFDRDAQEFMQCAGGVDNRYTCEMRWELSPKAYSHVVIGCEPPNLVEPPHTKIYWENCETLVYPSEVLGPEHLERLFVFYFDYGSIPPEFTIRELL